MGTRRDDDEKEGVLAEGDLDNKDTEQLLAEGEMVGTWSDDEDDDDDLLAGDDSVGPWSEDDLEFGLRADGEAPDDEELTQESVDEAADEDIDQLTDMPDPRARR
jgi:hypothetical protein